MFSAVAVAIRVAGRTCSGFDSCFRTEYVGRGPVRQRLNDDLRRIIVKSSRISEIEWSVPVKLYRIGEVVRHSGFSRQTVHNYTTMGLIHERERTDGGHRMYGEEVFQSLALIRRLKDSKTLNEIREVLKSQGLLDEQRAMAGSLAGHM